MGVMKPLDIPGHYEPVDEPPQTLVSIDALELTSTGFWRTSMIDGLLRAQAAARKDRAAVYLTEHEFRPARDDDWIIRSSGAGQWRIHLQCRGVHLLFREQPVNAGDLEQAERAAFGHETDDDGVVKPKPDRLSYFTTKVEFDAEYLWAVRLRSRTVDELMDHCRAVAQGLHSPDGYVAPQRPGESDREYEGRAMRERRDAKHGARWWCWSDYDPGVCRIDLCCDLADKFQLSDKRCFRGNLIASTAWIGDDDLAAAPPRKPRERATIPYTDDGHEHANPADVKRSASAKKFGQRPVDDFEAEVHKVGRKFTGFTFGVGHCRVRIYWKDLLARKREQTWLLDAWDELRFPWRRRGAFRIEAQLRTQWLKKRKVYKFDDIKGALSDIWRDITYESVRLVRREDRFIGRLNVCRDDERWSLVREAWGKGAGLALAAPPMRRLDQLEAQLCGVLGSYLAAMESSQSIAERRIRDIERHLHDSGILEDRIDDELGRRAMALPSIRAAVGRIIREQLVKDKILDHSTDAARRFLSMKWRGVITSGKRLAAIRRSMAQRLALKGPLNASPGIRIADARAQTGGDAGVDEAPPETGTAAG